MSTSAATISTRPSGSNRATPAGRSETFADRFVNFWWVEIPRRLRRYSTLLWVTWSDGIYLTAWPRVATMLVFVVFAFGLAEGATHWSYRTIVGTNGFAGNVLAPMATANDWGGPTHLVFADNLLLLMIGVAFGTLSANLGIMLVIGYAVGDLFGPPLPLGPGWRNIDPFNTWIYRHVPLLTSYILFFMLAALPILMAMELARTSHQRVARSKALMIGLTAIIEAALIYSWSAMAPMVFRTVQLWSGGAPRITVPFYMHVTLRWLVPTAVLAVLLRGVLFRAGVRHRRVFDAVQAVAAQARETLRTPRWVGALISSGVITLLMTGFLHNPSTYEPSLLTNFGEAELVFLGLVAALLARAYWLPRSSDWQRWAARVEQYPAALRIAAATIATFILCLILIAIPGLKSVRPGEFGVEVASILVGFALTLVLLPRGWGGLPAGSRVLPWYQLKVPSRATQAALFVAVFLLDSKRAFADCYDYVCCFASLPGAAAAAASGWIPGLGGVANTSSDPTGAPGSGSAAGNGSSGKDGEPWWKRAANALGIGQSIGLGGGFSVSTDKPNVKWGGSVDVGDHVTADVGVSVGVTPGNDPTGPILDINVDAKVQGHPATEGPGVEVGGSDHITVGISQPMQQADRSPGGGAAAQQVINDANNECSDGTFGNCSN